jgi:hypothetical protein
VREVDALTATLAQEALHLVAAVCEGRGQRRSGLRGWRAWC